MPLPSRYPVIESEATLARYPFLPQASAWMSSLAQKHHIDLEELIEGSILENARKRARMRLIDTVDNKEGVDVYGTGDVHSEHGRLIEAFSFYFARLVVCASGDERLISRWAQAEASRAEKLLQVDNMMSDISKTYFEKINFDTESDEWHIGIGDFVEVCPSITGSRWRLPNCELSDGWIRLHDEKGYSSKNKVARLLRERIKQAIVNDASQKQKDITPELEVQLAEHIGMVVGLMASKQSEAISLVTAGEDDWPPCMKQIIGELSQGVNVNHYGRLFLASMARTLGLPTANCVDFFRHAPDFSESVTTYQVEHVYQHEYTPSGCAKLKLNHNCPVSVGDDRLCDQTWMDHPLKYTKAKQRRRRLGEKQIEESSPKKSDD